jgi:hypothetical protein
LKGRKEGKRARKKEKMVRGHAKAIAQEKNAAKSSAKAKSVKRDSSEVCLFSFSGSIHDYHHHHLLLFLLSNIIDKSNS